MRKCGRTLSPGKSVRICGLVVGFEAYHRLGRLGMGGGGEGRILSRVMEGGETEGVFAALDWGAVLTEGEVRVLIESSP